VIRVVVADDQELVRSGFVAIVDTQDDMQVVGEAPDGIEAMSVARSVRPYVVLMDIRMPRLDGIRATREITSELHETRVILLTTFDLDEYVHEGFRAGASAFFFKDMPRDELLEGIRRVTRGDSLVAPALTRRLIENYVSRPLAGASMPTPLAELSPREIEVLQLIAAGQSNAEIAERLHLAAPTVKSHVGHILTKLGVRDRVQAVVLAYESGLVAPTYHHPTS
jgi:DNA-binding NarL/FixJ family response regulator